MKFPIAQWRWWLRICGKHPSVVILLALLWKVGYRTGSNCMRVHLSFRFHSYEHSFGEFHEWNFFVYSRVSWVLQNLYGKEMNEVTYITVHNYTIQNHYLRNKRNCRSGTAVIRVRTGITSNSFAGGWKMILALLSLGHTLKNEPRLWRDKMAIFLQFWI